MPLPQPANDSATPQIHSVAAGAQEIERENEGREHSEDDPRLMPAGNVARWKWGIDEQGNRVKESNARIVKWSDGTTQLMIGNRCAFDVVTRPIRDHHAVFAKLGAGVIERQTVVSESLHLRPTAETRRTFNKHQTAIKAQYEAAKKIRKVVMRQPVDAKAQEELHRKRLKERETAKRNAIRQQESTGLTADFLEQDSSGSDTDEEEEFNRRKRLAVAQSKPAAGSGSDSSDIDMSDDDVEASVAESAESRQEPSEAAGLPKKKRAWVAMDDGSEDED